MTRTSPIFEDKAIDWGNGDLCYSSILTAKECKEIAEECKRDNEYPTKTAECIYEQLYAIKMGWTE